MKSFGKNSPVATYIHGKNAAPVLRNCIAAADVPQMHTIIPVISTVFMISGAGYRESA
jgi:hypothetical protein